MVSEGVCSNESGIESSGTRITRSQSVHSPSIVRGPQSAVPSPSPQSQSTVPQSPGDGPGTGDHLLSSGEHLLDLRHGVVDADRVDVLANLLRRRMRIAGE